MSASECLLIAICVSFVAIFILALVLGMVCKQIARLRKRDLEGFKRGVREYLDGQEAGKGV